MFLEIFLYCTCAKRRLQAVGAHVSATQHYLTFAPESKTPPQGRCDEAAPLPCAERRPRCARQARTPRQPGRFPGLRDRAGRGNDARARRRPRLPPPEGALRSGRAGLFRPQARRNATLRRLLPRPVTLFGKALTESSVRLRQPRKPFGDAGTFRAQAPLDACRQRLLKHAGLPARRAPLPGTDEKRRPQHATAVSSAIPFPWCSAGGTRHAEPSSPPASPGIRLFPSDTPRTRPCPSDARTS